MYAQRVVGRQTKATPDPTNSSAHHGGAPGASWDFTKIAMPAHNLTSRCLATPPFIGLRRPSAVPPRFISGPVNDSYEHVAARVPDQLNRAYPRDSSLGAVGECAETADRDRGPSSFSPDDQLPVHHEPNDQIADPAKGPAPVEQPSPAQAPPATPPRSDLQVDKINLVTTGAGAAGGYPPVEDVCNATLNSPGPFNDTAQGAIANVHQVHVHMKKGFADQPSLSRTVKRKASSAGQPFDRTGSDGPPQHEITFPKGPKGDQIVVADAPGWCVGGKAGIPPSRFPLTYSADFTFAVFDALNGRVLARLDYHVDISKSAKADDRPTNTVTAQPATIF